MNMNSYMNSLHELETLSNKCITEWIFYGPKHQITGYTTPGGSEDELWIVYSYSRYSLWHVVHM